MNGWIGTVATGLAMAMLAVPAMAHPQDHDRRERYSNDWRGGQFRYQRNMRDDYRNERQQDLRWLNQKRQQMRARAYANGYQDGRRVDNRRYSDRYYNNRYDNGYYYGNGGYPVYSGPVYNNAAYRSSNPYWWGANGQVYCRRSDGTTGTIIGAIAGGTLGNLIAGHGDKTVGSIIGGTLGAVLGNQIAKGDVRCR